MRKFMEEALREAKKAYALGEVPVGAVVVRGGEIISRAHNMVEAYHDPTAHAEILAIREAAVKLGSWRLNDCEIYVTLEPCIMCTGAIGGSRMKTLIYGANDSKEKGLEVIRWELKKTNNLGMEIYEGIMEEECKKLLKDFFKEQRADK
ncbi:nucleoside deaminase [Alkalibacter saccharofermentans]|uniref:tRNA-specific adenosine deaminase n=1 Tax=Alkalibacter saccharofermentans DSM 14828 TaxID=1120975 RepID=A0A1M4WVS8_9FIRM|nr:nucleoside deaminase [Alkalibacter saccharofermentans]SHE85298.1 tRNA-adenosine deaminase [Alkalibacter saccharofermentans DSM 14828]